VDRYGPQVPTKLAEVPDIQQFLRRFVARETLKSLQVLSLLARIGWEENLREEARSIAKFLRLPFAKLESAVIQLKRQGVVVARGRYLYVSPDLLAIEAAASLWDEKGAHLIDLVLKLQPDPRRQLLQRLAMMGDHQEVKKAVDRILSRDGLYPSLKELDEPFLAEVFRILSSAVPPSATDLLSELILPATKETLEDFKNGRREIMWAIESLLRWPDTSLKAAQVLMKLALSETETVANNATSIFETFFQLFLSGSPVPLMDRFILVDELLNSDDPSARQLAVSAIAATLQSHESRFGGNSDSLSGKPFPPEWRPKTNGEVWEVRRRALAYLQQVGDRNDEAAVLARRARIGSIRALIQYGQFDDALSVLESAAPHTDEERRQVMESCDEIIKIENLPPELADRARKVREAAFGHSYLERLRRWVGKRINSDFDASSATGYEAADKEVIMLADEGFKNGIGGAETDWLTSPEAENVWVYGDRLGEIDANGKFLDQIVGSTPDDINCLFLASYVRGRARLNDESLNSTLDKVAAEKPHAAFGATWRNNPTTAGAERIIRLVSLGYVPASSLRVLLYGAWVEKLPPAYATRLVDLMLSADNGANLEAVLGIIDHSVRAGTISVQQFGDLIWKALEAKGASRSPNFDWHWGRVADLVASIEPAKLARIFVTLFESDNTWLATDSAQGVLQVATRANPEAVWEVIAPVLLGSDLTAVRLRIKLDHWFGELIPGDILVKWAHRHGPRGFLMAAGLLNAKVENLSASARLLLREAPNPEEVMSHLAAGLGTGMFAGPLSSHLEGDLSTLEKWTRDEEPRIRSWAQKALKHERKRLQRVKLLEEERYL
jgi:hypothetical protein